MDVCMGEGLANAAFVVMQILAGGYLPLQLWPEWMQKFLYYQPFATLMDVPMRFYVGVAQLSQLRACCFCRRRGRRRWCIWEDCGIAGIWTAWSYRAADQK